LKKYFDFTVLPFGLQSSAYIFSKVLRPLVAHWCRNSIQVVLYLDDGFGVAEDQGMCSKHSDIVTKDTILSGLVPNKDKCVWSPSQQLDRLGFRWDLKQCLLPVPDRRLSDLYELIILVLENSTAVKVRTLAKVCGKIIAMSPELSYVTQVMTRCIFSVLNLKDDWKQIININYHNDCIRELVFWKLNIFDFKPASLLEKSYNFDIFTDASDSGAAGFIQNTTFVMHVSLGQNRNSKSRFSQSYY
jgi:hypothetical protein